MLSLELSDAVTNVTPVWSRVRDKLSDVAPSLPEGVQTPELLDDRGYAFSIVAALRWTLDTEADYKKLTHLANQLPSHASWIEFLQFDSEYLGLAKTGNGN